MIKVIKHINSFYIQHKATSPNPTWHVETYFEYLQNLLKGGGANECFLSHALH
jgi:hypothetical protein